jgi:hypothetical protein
MELHPAVEPLAVLLGTWTGEGHGDYPSIESFDYGEELTFWHVGKPFLFYTQRTWILADGRPSHSEMGYWRGTDDGVELVVAHPTGIVEIDTGRMNGSVIDLETATVGLSPTAKSVTGLRRRYEVSGDVLRYDLWMAAVGQPLTHHLRGELRRSS